VSVKIIEGEKAESLDREEKWRLLSPYLRRHGREALSYATLQGNMEYFIVEDKGYVAYVSVRHFAFAPRGVKIALVDPVCAVSDYSDVVGALMEHCRHVVFVPASKELAQALRPMGFKFVCVGYEPEIPIQTYKTKGNWKDLDLIKRARNEARRKGVTIREEPDLSQVDRGQLDAVSQKWLGSKILNDREIWVYARNPVYENEPDVRKFVAYDKDGVVAGFAFYDPIYRDGEPRGYAANTSRCDETNFGKLSTAVHMHAAEVFREEGKDVLNLCLAPFDKVDMGEYNDHWITKTFFKLCRRYGEGVYNFGGLSFFKSKYRANEVPKYFASNGLLPHNDVYLAYLSSGIVQSYFPMLAKFCWGVLTGVANDGLRRIVPGRLSARRSEKTDG